MMLIDDVGKAVTTYRIVSVKSLSVHIPELLSAQSGVFCTDGSDELQDESFLSRLHHHFGFIVLVICLLRYAKQLTKKLNTIPYGVL